MWSFTNGCWRSGTVARYLLGYAPGAYESFRDALPRWVHQNLRLPEVIGEALGPEFRGEFLWVDHHESHASSAFFPTPFREAAILTLDVVGEWATSAIGHGADNQITLSKEMRFPHSLGMLYSAFTYYTGFKVD